MTKITNPFDAAIHSTERTGNQQIVEWLNQIIREEKLGFGLAKQETSGTDRKQPDIILQKSPKSTEIALLLELKPPYFDPLDLKLRDEARYKATSRHASYFVTSNFKSLYLFNTEKANKLAREDQQLVQKYQLSHIEDLNLLDDISIKMQIVKTLAIFLRDVHEYIFGKKEERLLPIDEVLIAILQEKVNTLTSFYTPMIENQVYNDPSFRKNLRKWFNDQGWNFTLQHQDFIKAARQTAYLVVNKILFYDVLRSTDPQHFAKMAIPEDFSRGGMVKRHLQNYFEVVLQIDYETIYSTDFIDTIAFPDDKNVIYHLRVLAEQLNSFDFSQIAFEVLGRIFEGLIPAEERHLLGQYFTTPDIVDLILAFAVRAETDTVFDPGCGAGTFLRRAYHLKKLYNPTISHEALLPTLWGNDIAKFPASLATLNLAIANLRSKENYPRIVQKDFFDWMPGKVKLPENTRKVFLSSLGEAQKEEVVPHYFDAIVGNPPYTRQEEMDDLVGEKGQEYKETLIEKAVMDESGRVYANLTKRAGLHAYFFVHGTKFLKEGGRFGFIVSNSWMDVDYGKGLQEHFLKHYKIRAIIESKVERWFPDADVNTCIVLLEKCFGANGEKQKQRDENVVRFVYLKKSLSHFIPKASRIFEETVERKAAVENLLTYMFGQTGFFENDDMRVYCKTQKELWDEGFDNGTHKYVGAKWGKYIRGPQIFFTILEKAKDKLVPLKSVADVRFGIKTGANEFFYLTEEEIQKRWIEKEFWMHEDKSGNWIPNYVIKSPRECKRIIVDSSDLKYRVLMIHKDRQALKGTRVLEYIKEGEEKGYHTRPTCASRKNWWDLGEQKPPSLLWFKAFNERVVFPLNSIKAFVSDRFYCIYPNDNSEKEKLSVVLNSSLLFLFVELWGRVNLGEGALDNMTYEAASVYIPNPDLFRTDGIDISDFLRKEIGSVFTEIGAEKENEVKLELVDSIRRQIDEYLIMKVLSFNQDELIAVYRAVVDLARSRLARAKSVKKKSKTREGVDVTLLVKTILEKIGGNKLGEYYKKHVLNKKDLKTISLPEFSDRVDIEQTLLGFRLEDEKKGIDFDTELEARYCKVFATAGWREVQMPKSKDNLEKAVQKLKQIEENVKEAIAYYTEGLLDNKLLEHVTRQVWIETSK